MKGRNVISIGPVSKSISADPRYAMAQQLMGGNDVEITDPYSGLNSAISRMLGAKQTKDLQKEYQTRDQSYNQDLSHAMGALMGRPAENQQLKDGGSIAWDEQAPNAKLAGQLLMNNPDTAELGQDFALQEYQNQQDLAQTQAGYDREDEKWKKDADLKRELAMMRAGANGTVTPQLNPETGEYEMVQSNAPRKLSATEQKEFYEAKDTTDAVKNAMGTLGQVENLQGQDMYSGMGSTLMAGANRIPLIEKMIPDDKAANTTTYNNLLKELAYSRLKATFPGAISNSEREALERLQALSSYSPSEQKKIISEAKTVLERQAQIAGAKQQGIVTGEVYDPSMQSTMSQTSPAAGNQADQIRVQLQGKIPPERIEAYIKAKGY
jgi:hypothetical protein